MTIERGFAGEDPERFEVNSLVEKVLPPDRIAEIAERVRAYTTSVTLVRDDATPDDGAEEDDEE